LNCKTTRGIGAISGWDCQVWNLISKDAKTRVKYVQNRVGVIVREGSGRQSW